MSACSRSLFLRYSKRAITQQQQKRWVSRIRSEVSSPLIAQQVTDRIILQKKSAASLNHVIHRCMVMVTQTKANEIPSHQSEKTSNDNESLQEQPTSSSIANNNNNNDNQTEKNLNITESCWKRIHQLASKRNDENLHLRVFVDAGGCSGFSYQFELESSDMIEDDDIIFYENNNNNNAGGAKVVVDPGTIDIIAGSTIDYVQEMIKSSFEVRDNPQSESACGCGSSFALKNFAANPALD